MKKQQYLFISIGIHIFVILVLVFFPWSSKKDEVVNSIQMVNADSMLPAGGGATPNPAMKPPEQPIQTPPPTKTEPIAPITAPKKDEILIPEKPKAQKPVVKPKPPKPQPKLQSKLKDKLKDLLKDEPENPQPNETTAPASDEDLKKNSPPSQDSKELVADQEGVTPSNSTNTPGL